MDSLKQKVKDIFKKLSADKKTMFIVLAGIIGVLILVASEFIPEGEEAKDANCRGKLP